MYVCIIPGVSLDGEPPRVVRADAFEGPGHQDRAVAGEDGGVVAGLVADDDSMMMLVTMVLPETKQSKTKRV